MPYSEEDWKIWQARGSPTIKEYPKEKEDGMGMRQHEIKFSNVLLTDKRRTTLDGPDGWRRRLFCKEGPRSHYIRQQQGRGGVMCWAAIVGNELVGPFSVSDGGKITSKVYVDFLKEHLVL